VTPLKKATAAINNETNALRILPSFAALLAASVIRRTTASCVD